LRIYEKDYACNNKTTYKTLLWIDAIFVSVDSDWPNKRHIVMLHQQLLLLLLLLLLVM